MSLPAGSRSAPRPRSGLPAQKARLAGLGLRGRVWQQPQPGTTTASVWRCPAGARVGGWSCEDCQDCQGPSRPRARRLQQDGRSDGQAAMAPDTENREAKVRAPPEGGGARAREVAGLQREAGTQAQEHPRATPGNTGS